MSEHKNKNYVDDSFQLHSMSPRVYLHIGGVKMGTALTPGVSAGAANALAMMNHGKHTHSYKHTHNIIYCH